jgi:hypothetical protein
VWFVGSTVSCVGFDTPTVGLELSASLIVGLGTRFLQEKN